MKIWVDAQLPPALAPWITERFGVQAFSASYLGYRDATDAEIFRAAREADAVVMTKDADFVRLLDVHGPPPKVLWVTLGNTSNARIRSLLERVFSKLSALFESGEALVELGEELR